MKKVELRRLVWARLAAEARNLPESGDAVSDLDENERGEHDIQRLDIACREVAEACERNAKGAR